MTEKSLTLFKDESHVVKFIKSRDILNMKKKGTETVNHIQHVMSVFKNCKTFQNSFSA